MSYQIPTIEPTEIFAGTTAKWRKVLADFIPSDGTLKYNFTNRTGNGFTVTCTDDGGSFLATIAATTTEGLTVGDWYWQSTMTVGSEIFPIQSGRTNVKANFVDANALDNRSHARKCLDIIEASLEGRLVDNVESHSMLGVSVSQLSIAEQVRLRDVYRAQVQSETQAEKLRLGLGAGNMIGVRFNNP